MFYIYQHFQDSEKIYQIDTDSNVLTTQEDSLYPYVNNDIEYRLFEDTVESYHLDSQIKDDFQCDPDCYTQTGQPTKDDHPYICTHDYQHIAQNIDDLADPTQQNKLYLSEDSTLSFTDDTDMQCDYSISAHTPDIPNTNDTQVSCQYTQPHILNENMHIEILSVMHTYSIMNSTTKIYSQSRKNTQHYYNKNYKTHIGTYMTQSQLKVTKFLKTWI